MYLSLLTELESRRRKYFARSYEVRTDSQIFTRPAGPTKQSIIDRSSFPVSNGKRETENGNWETGNGKRKTGNRKRETGNGERPLRLIHLSPVCSSLPQIQSQSFAGITISLLLFHTVNFCVTMIIQILRKISFKGNVFTRRARGIAAVVREQLYYCYLNLSLIFTSN